MSRKLYLILLCIAAVVSLVSISHAAHPQAGTLAPQFTLESQDGTPVSLAQFRGKWIVLYFYPKDFTSGCTLEAHNFQRDLAGYEKRNAVILGVSLDTPDSHRQFCVKEGLSFKLLSDSDHTVSKQYGTLTHVGFTHATRNTFLIAPDGRIARVFEDVDPANHSGKVLAALTELQQSHKA